MKLILGQIGDIGSNWISVDSHSGAHYSMLLGENTRFDSFSKYGTIDCIYSSHMIEHITDKAAQNIFNESYKALREGGVLRICAPDVMYYVNSYRTKEKRAFFVDEYGVGSNRTYKEEVMLLLGISNENARPLEPHNLLCCIINSGKYDFEFDKDIMEQKMDESIDELIKWSISQYDFTSTNEHSNGFYAEKVMSMMKEAGFIKIFEMPFRDSHFEEIKHNPLLDLELRKNNSFYVEAIK